MPKFLVIYRQTGGCDYTIGCGVSVVTIEAPSMDAAVAIVTEGLTRNDGDTYDDDTVESIHQVDVYEIAAHENTHVVLTTDTWLEARRNARAKARTEAKEYAEHAELERLKKKYGP